jgi:hypothetical protein
MGGPRREAWDGLCAWSTCAAADCIDMREFWPTDRADSGGRRANISPAMVADESTGLGLG